MAQEEKKANGRAQRQSSSALGSESTEISSAQRRSRQGPSADGDEHKSSPPKVKLEDTELSCPFFSWQCIPVVDKVVDRDKRSLESPSEKGNTEFRTGAHSLVVSLNSVGEEQ